MQTQIVIALLVVLLIVNVARNIRNTNEMYMVYSTEVLPAWVNQLQTYRLLPNHVNYFDFPPWVDMPSTYYQLTWMGTTPTSMQNTAFATDVVAYLSHSSSSTTVSLFISSVQGSTLFLQDQSDHHQTYTLQINDNTEPPCILFLTLPSGLIVKLYGHNLNDEETTFNACPTTH